MAHHDTDEIAAVYNTHGDDYHQSRTTASGRLFNEFIDIPAALSLLPADLTGVRVLDAGCGSGIYARLLAQRGAHVTGVDASTAMIEIARRETPSELGVSYTVGSLYDVPVPDQAYDLIVCTYVLENVDDLSAVFREFNRVLMPTGSIVMSLSHPLRAVSKKDQRDGRDVWTVDDYFQGGTRHSDFGNGMIVPKYVRSLDDYAAAISKAGFVIDRLLEPRPIPEGQTVDPEGFERARRLPQVLTLRLTKRQ